MKGIITILLLGFMSALHAQINSVKRTSGDISQFERADFSIQLTGNWTNPYLQEEISLDMLLLAPNGEKLEKLLTGLPASHRSKPVNTSMSFACQKMGKK